MIGHFSKIYFIFLFFTTHALLGQSSNELKLREAKRFIDKVEVFAGPSFSFNYGNIFIENYRGKYAGNNYVENKRLTKPGYVFGAGVYHSLTNRIDLNVRILYERKGTKNKFNSPLNPVNDDSRQIIIDNYTYNYFTISASPTLYLDHKRIWSVSFGVYYSKIKNVRGASESYNTRDFQVNEGSFEGRYFYHLREDGAIDGFSWNPFLTGIETYDYGIVTSIGYRISINEMHTFMVQLQNNLGIKNINKDNPYELEEKNHSITLVISYNYKFPPEK